MDDPQTWMLAAGGLILIVAAVWAIVVGCLHELQQDQRLVRSYHQQIESFRVDTARRA